MVRWIFFDKTQQSQLIALVVFTVFKKSMTVNQSNFDLFACTDTKFLSDGKIKIGKLIFFDKKIYVSAKYVNDRTAHVFLKRNASSTNSVFMLSSRDLQQKQPLRVSQQRQEWGNDKSQNKDKTKSLHEKTTFDSSEQDDAVRKCKHIVNKYVHLCGFVRHSRSSQKQKWLVSG
ncbi:hypothetical protein RFI_02861 [Reticulomyxa filosa]|uniref:Uncharacterized protein n=1 Tax=Reticulomyxa filosa TaxID=46433 RepID=X6P836_RETFI|nr:hypothetical protein RFI_02861 [Reticulomyxa filosa]|eukprot:ETO34234.1 hypothetical protein RFI_02861 [Reticulomyxa filosa]